MFPLVLFIYLGIFSTTTNKLGHIDLNTGDISIVSPLAVFLIYCIFFLWFYIVLECSVLPTLKNGIINYTFTRNIWGTYAYYSCHKGYLLIGTGWKYCEISGDWTAGIMFCQSKNNTYNLY